MDWRKLTKEDRQTGSRTGSFARPELLYSGTYSVFPIPLAEWIFVRYGGKAGTKVVDAFAGGPPRGIVAGLLGYEYHGFDVRQAAIDEDRYMAEQLELTGVYYHLGDARELKASTCSADKFDMAITCPPFFNIEVYSEQKDDLSTFATYEDFDYAMLKVAHAHKRVMKPNSFVCIVVGNFRDKVTDEVIDFRGHTVKNFQRAGFKFWQDIVLATNPGSAPMRASNYWRGSRKLVPRHQYLLVFITPPEKVNYDEYSREVLG